MTKPSEGSKELIDWLLYEPSYTPDDMRDKIEAHVKPEIRKTLLKIKEQAKSVHEILEAGDEYYVDKSVALSAIDYEIKSLEER